MNRGEFQHFLRDIFTQRRKLLRGVVANLFKPRLSKQEVDEVLESMQFPPDTRAEELKVAQLVELSNRLQLKLTRATLLGDPTLPGDPTLLGERTFPDEQRVAGEASGRRRGCGRTGIEPGNGIAKD